MNFWKDKSPDKRHAFRRRNRQDEQTSHQRVYYNLQATIAYSLRLENDEVLEEYSE
jgi:hypothetical protein